MFPLLTVPTQTIIRTFNVVFKYLFMHVGNLKCRDTCTSFYTNFRHYYCISRYLTLFRLDCLVTVIYVQDGKSPCIYVVSVIYISMCLPLCRCLYFITSLENELGKAACTSYIYLLSTHLKITPRNAQNLNLNVRVFRKWEYQRTQGSVGEVPDIRVLQEYGVPLL